MRKSPLIRILPANVPPLGHDLIETLDPADTARLQRGHNEAGPRDGLLVGGALAPLQALQSSSSAF
eukprot:6213124-Pyramimonas_sp.AAC.1